MSELFDRITEATAFIRSRTDLRPDVALILGSGLGALADEMDVAATIAYPTIPHFPPSTVEGHR
ncbi:MAG: purine-nucleoside phosphorylase, partial [Chloroflexi bacterium]|nr:purine-nucleoside phosphorylase [Chloroflexota bacterium]